MLPLENESHLFLVKYGRFSLKQLDHWSHKNRELIEVSKLCDTDKTEPNPFQIFGSKGEILKGITSPFPPQKKKTMQWFPKRRYIYIHIIYIYTIYIYTIYSIYIYLYQLFTGCPFILRFRVAMSQ